MQPQQRVPIFNCFQNHQVHSNWTYNELRFLVSTKSEGSSKMPNIYKVYLESVYFFKNLYSTELNCRKYKGNGRIFIQN